MREELRKIIIPTGMGVVIQKNENTVLKTENLNTCHVVMIKTPNYIGMHHIPHPIPGFKKEDGESYIRSIATEMTKNLEPSERASLKLEMILCEHSPGSNKGFKTSDIKNILVSSFNPIATKEVMRHTSSFTSKVVLTPNEKSFTYEHKEYISRPKYFNETEGRVKRSEAE